MELQEEYRILRDRWRKRLLKSFCIIVGILFLVEIGIFIMMRYGSFWPRVSGLRYWMKYIFLPSGLNLAALLVTRAILFGRASERVKNLSVIGCMLTICMVIASFHGFFLSTTCIFVVPMAVSVMMDDIRIVNGTAVACVAAMFLSLFPAHYFDGNWSFADRLTNAFGTMIFIGLFYFVCAALLRSSEEKRNVIFSSAKKNEEMRHALKVDSMTGLYNHTEFYNRLERYLGQFRESGLLLTIAVVDVDFFKKINDTYGHDSGDAVLLKIAEILKEYCDSDGHIFRYGGEEFAVIFRHRTEREAGELLDQARKAINETAFESMPGQTVGISCGIFEYRGEQLEAQEVFTRADKAMYAAKSGGRNRCICYSNFSE